jgi:hypothetical protein
MRTEINVTFVKDCEPRYESGWEAYPKGAKATLPGGVALVKLGYAREGWGAVEPKHMGGPMPRGQEYTLKDPGLIVMTKSESEREAIESTWVETTVEEYRDLPPEWDAPSLKDLTVKELRKRLKDEGLPIRGNKAALVKRLRGD